MGLADMFIKLGVEYGSRESIDLSWELGRVIRNTAYQQSVDLAKIHGTYPKFDSEIVSQSEYFKSLPEELQVEILKYGMRNSHVLSIAPTGSISTMWNISGGIEPIFAKSYTRTTKSLGNNEDIDYKVYTHIVKEFMNRFNITDEEDLPDYFVTSHDIGSIDRIKLQSAWQNVVDSAISSTINLDESVTPEEISEIYKLAWSYNLKGITVFRNNCFRTGILTTTKPEVEEEDDEGCST